MQFPPGRRHIILNDKTLFNTFQPSILTHGRSVSQPKEFAISLMNAWFLFSEGTQVLRELKSLIYIPYITLHIKIYPFLLRIFCPCRSGSPQPNLKHVNHIALPRLFVFIQIFPHPVFPTKVWQQLTLRWPVSFKFFILTQLKARIKSQKPTYSGNLSIKEGSHALANPSSELC